MKTNLPCSLRSLVLFGALLAALAGSSGCVFVAAGAGAGAVAYVRGKLDATLSSSFDNSVAATNRAIQDLKLAKVSERRDALVAVFVVRNAEDKKIEIRLENAAKDITKIQIGVGVFGDEPLSIAILERIKNNL